MAEKAQFNNLTEDTVRRMCKVYELWANQIANPYGIVITDNVKVTRKEEVAPK